MSNRNKVKMYTYIKELSIEKMKDEKQREESLIRQSSYIQASVSIGLTGISVIINSFSKSIIYGKKNWLLKIAVVNIFISLICSLFVQWRNKKASLNNIDCIEKRILENEDKFKSEEVQLKDWVQHMNLIQKSLNKSNTVRMYEIMVSIISYMIAVTTILLYCYINFI